MTYFDSLVHVTPDGRWFDTTVDASERRLLTEMDRADVECAVVVGLPGHIDNAFVRDLCDRQPTRLVPGGGFDPSACATPRQVAARLRREIRADGFPVLKLHPRLNRYDLLDPRATAMFEELGTWRRAPAIWLDSLLYPAGVRMKRPIVETLRHLVEQFSNLRFVLLHAGGAKALEFYDAFAPLPNVLLDLSYSLTRYAGSSLAQDHRFLLERFDRRVVFGSDFPEVSLVEATAAFERLGAGLPRDKVDNVRRGNLRALLGRA